VPNLALRRTGGLVSPFEWGGFHRPPAAELDVRRLEYCDALRLRCLKSMNEGAQLMVHFPVFLPVRNTNEFPLVRVNEEMSKCLPVFTSKELAELYVAEEGTGMNLCQIDDHEGLSRFVGEMVRNHGVAHYAINFTFKATSVKCGPASELIDAKSSE
jgi:hypothetical protein